MTDQHSLGAKLEIAHVLLIDVVGYSRLLIDDQQAAVQKLNKAVRDSGEFRSADAAGKVIRLPTGDGAALIFFTTPEAPVRCAVEVTRQLRSHDSPAQVRMGIHSGPVTYVQDVDGGTNVAGAGINLAQRVMDCGDAGHILLSQRVAEDIGQFREWLTHLHEIGGCDVKHGVRVHLFNLHGADFGNPALPGKVAAATATLARARRLRLWWQAAAAAGVIIALAAAVWLWKHRSDVSNVVPDKSIAVLPFENISEDKSTGFFADGMEDDILTSLAKIHDLRVVSRTSVENYRGRQKGLSVRAIAQQLGVANVLEGSVRRDGNRVVVNVQLIDARQDRHLWANRYDETLNNSLGMQGQLAREVADALRATLTPEEKAGIQRKPTENAQAYELYLQARQYEFKPDGFLQDYRTAEQLYLQAITLDPGFALAHVGLATTCARIYHFYEPTEEWRKRAREEAEKSLELEPNLGEGHHALGLCYYWFERDYQSALREFAIAKSFLPNDSEVAWHVAAIKRRQGRWHEVAEDYRAILLLDPQNANIVRDLLYVYCATRDWPNTQETAERLFALTPNSVNAKAQIGYVEFWMKGSTARLKSEMATVPPGNDPDGAVTAIRMDASLIDRDAAAAERALLASPLDTFSYYNGVDTPRSFFAGQIALMRGDESTARKKFGQARDFFAAAVAEAPDIPDRHACLGLACAFAGDKDRAIAEGKRAVELLPVSQDALDGSIWEAILALIYARTGERAQAIEMLRHLLSVPGAVDTADYSITTQDLKARWEWDPIRDDPEFQKLISGNP